MPAVQRRAVLAAEHEIVFLPRLPRREPFGGLAGVMGAERLDRPGGQLQDAPALAGLGVAPYQYVEAAALSSTVNLNVDLDIMLCVLAQALLAAFRTRLGAGYATATPGTLQRRFLDTPGTIINDSDTVTIRIDRRAYSPVLRQADLPADTTVPRWAGRRLHFEFA